jgi:hypothetical protein
MHVVLPSNARNFKARLIDRMKPFRCELFPFTQVILQALFNF